MADIFLNEIFNFKGIKNILNKKYLEAGECLTARLGRSFHWESSEPVALTTCGRHSKYLTRQSPFRSWQVKAIRLTSLWPWISGAPSEKWVFPLGVPCGWNSPLGGGPRWCFCLYWSDFAVYLLGLTCFDCYEVLTMSWHLCMFNWAMLTSLLSSSTWTLA